MPSRPPRVCPRCQSLIFDKRCECKPAWSNSNGGRTESSKVTSTRRWIRLRNQVRADQPMCAVDGCVRLTEQVDHIVPLAHGGEPYLRENLQGLCLKHHKAKSLAERTGH